MVTLSTLANLYGEKPEVMLEGITYSSLAIINKEELLGEWQDFKRAVFQEKAMMEKNHQLSIFARHKRHHGNKLCLYIPETFKMNIFLVLPIGTASVNDHLVI